MKEFHWRRSTKCVRLTWSTAMRPVRSKYDRSSLNFSDPSETEVWILQAAPGWHFFMRIKIIRSRLKSIEMLDSRCSKCKTWWTNCKLQLEITIQFWYQTAWAPFELHLSLFGESQIPVDAPWIIQFIHKMSFMIWIPIWNFQMNFRGAILVGSTCCKAADDRPLMGNRWSYHAAIMVH